MKHLINIQKKLKAPKGQYNSFGKYKYRSAEDILEAVKPLVHEEGCVLTLTDALECIGDRYYVKATATLKTPDREFVTSAYAREDESKKGMDGSQISGTASSYARKYALNGLFCIDDAKDADTDEYRYVTTTPSLNKAELITKINALAEVKGVKISEICEMAKASSLDDIPVERLNSCVVWLNKKND